MCVINIYKFHDVAFSNQIWSQLLWRDLHPSPDIVFTVRGRQILATGQSGVDLWNNHFEIL